MQFYLWFGYAFMLLSATILIFVVLWTLLKRYAERQASKPKIKVQRSSDVSENEDEIVASN